MILLLFCFLFCTFINARETREIEARLVIPKALLSPPTPPPPTIINNQNANALFGAFNAFHFDKEALSLYATLAQHWLKEHQQQLMYAAAIVVVAYFYHLYWRAHHLMRTRSWTSWCSDRDMNIITEDRLLTVLHQYHLNATTINNQRLLFATFLETLDEEKNILQKASWIDWILDKLHIRKLVTLDQVTVAQSLKNLEELRTCFVKWYAHQILTKGFTDA